MEKVPFSHLPYHCQSGDNSANASIIVCSCGIQLNMSTEESKKMLRRHVYKKTNLVIMFVDINDSTNMSLSLSQNKFALIV